VAVELFKHGKSTLVEPEYLDSMIDQGWSVIDPSAPAALPPGMVMINQQAEPLLITDTKEEDQPLPVVETKRRGRPKRVANDDQGANHQ
jgi:hypothetical protein